ncbi:MAG: GNAT family N-acetyltransferase [Candidatus Dormibacteria bacterium]
MAREPELRTDRLLLRRWRPEDLDPFAVLNADPVVMEHFAAGVSTREKTADFMARIEQEFEDRGFGLWAVEVPGVAGFVGFVGLHAVPFQAHFTPAVEVGWRLAREHWHKGYATEAARAAVAFGYERAGLAEVLSFTNVANVRSQRVMERIGMTRDLEGDFEHPQVPEGHPIRPHVLYRFPRGSYGRPGE